MQAPNPEATCQLKSGLTPRSMSAFARRRAPAACLALFAEVLAFGTELLSRRQVLGITVRGQAASNWVSSLVQRSAGVVTFLRGCDTGGFGAAGLVVEAPSAFPGPRTRRGGRRAAIAWRGRAIVCSGHRQSPAIVGIRPSPPNRQVQGFGRRAGSQAPVCSPVPLAGQPSQNYLLIWWAEIQPLVTP